MNLVWITIGVLSSLSSYSVAYTDVPCQWNSKTGASYDLRPLTITEDDQTSYFIRDGDIPCTPEIERTYSFVWNFCAPVTEASFPSVCKSDQIGAALQYFYRESDKYQECNVIGQYDPARDDTYYRLLEETDPSKGVSVVYQFGDKCPNGDLRSTTIDVMCTNTKALIVSALEPDTCQYHMVMKSWYGCPQSCPVTGNGLCDSHGHCSFDKGDRSAHCFCNEGHSGKDCSTKGNSTTYDGFSVQMGLLITLLIIALILVGAVGFLAYKVTEFRKGQQYSSYSSLPGTEMVERVI